MENKLNVSVVLPINSSKIKNFEEYFNSCILSLHKQTTKIDELVIVHSDEESLKLVVENFDYSGLTVNLIENKGDVERSLLKKFTGSEGKRVVIMFDSNI